MKHGKPKHVYYHCPNHKGEYFYPVFFCFYNHYTNRTTRRIYEPIEDEL